MAGQHEKKPTPKDRLSLIALMLSIIYYIVQIIKAIQELLK